ncbi:MAG: adenylosuccinate lyase [Phycisphaerales bacterium]|nr:adenylosuccinate lyase [Phycisphaerales bacterium]
MATGQELYISPLVTRNASERMSRLFGAEHRIATWRRLWIALAEAQRELGLPITAKQIAALKRAAGKIDFAKAARYEAELRHDVMAHLHAFGDEAPSARGILHLGATSCYVVDNADLIIMREALELIAQWLAGCIDRLAKFAKQHRALPVLGFTHYQPAQLTTVGKRAALWCYDFVRDLEEIETRIERLRFRGVKGATGTQASFLELFDGSHAKVKRLEKAVAKAMGFAHIEPVTGQTYSRKVDAQVVAALAGVAQSVHKYANDMRLLCNLKEIEEPFEKSQVGSSAMPYKRNPMRMERATGLARWVLSIATSPQMTAAEQWFERTLDDSSNKRLAVPEAFLATDGMLKLVHNVSGGMVVYPKVIQARVMSELPFIASENIMMAATKAGADRQEAHERIRRHSQSAGEQVKKHGKPNDLIDRLEKDDAFAGVDFAKVLNPKAYTGRSAEQVDEFITAFVTPIRKRYAKSRALESKLNV